MKTLTEVQAIKKEYPIGTGIIIDHVDDIHAPAPGTKLIIRSVDDIGQLHCYELGIAIVPGVDKFHKVDLRYQVKRVEFNGERTLLILEDTIGNGFPNISVYEDEQHQWIYHLSAYLNKHLGEEDIIC